MIGKLIEYKSGKTLITPEAARLGTSLERGVAFSWVGLTVRNPSYLYQLLLSWEFDWEHLKRDDIDRITGHFVLKPTASADFAEQKIDIEWTKGIERIPIRIPVLYSTTYVTFEYSLTPHYSEARAKRITPIDFIIYTFANVFNASDTNDTCLIVEGQRIYVNKEFLSSLSGRFRDLFSSNLTEYRIDDVSYQDLRLLLSTTKHNLVKPDDDNAEKLLELADRFLMPSVTRLVELCLLEGSRLGIARLLWIADAYGFKDLLEERIQWMNNLEKVKGVENSEHFEKMSEAIKARVAERRLHFSQPVSFVF